MHQGSLLSGNSESLSASTGGLGSLSSNSNAPVMSETSVVLGLLHSFQVLSQDGIELIGNQVGPSSVSWVLLSVHEPLWDVVLTWSSTDVVEGSDLLLSDFSRSLVEINLGDLHNKDSESFTDTSDLSETEWGLLFTVDVCVLHSKNMSELVWVLQYQ